MSEVAPADGPSASAPAAEVRVDDDALAPLLAALGGEARDAALKAAFALGEALAGQATTPDGQRVVALLEAIAERPATGAWLRKRAKRALKKIRGEAEG